MVRVKPPGSLQTSTGYNFTTSSQPPHSRHSSSATETGRAGGVPRPSGSNSRTFRNPQTLLRLQQLVDGAQDNGLTRLANGTLNLGGSSARSSSSSAESAIQIPLSTLSLNPTPGTQSQTTGDSFKATMSSYFKEIQTITENELSACREEEGMAPLIDSIRPFFEIYLTTIETVCSDEESTRNSQQIHSILRQLFIEPIVVVLTQYQQDANTPPDQQNLSIPSFLGRLSLANNLAKQRLGFDQISSIFKLFPCDSMHPDSLDQLDIKTITASTNLGPVCTSSTGTQIARLVEIISTISTAIINSAKDIAAASLLSQTR